MRLRFDFIQKILHEFPNLNADWLITGEGEQPLAELICQLLGASPSKMSSPLPDGVHAARGHASSSRLYQLPRLENLPVPDYKDYFDLIETFPPADRFFPTLPVEASRGCWWGERKQCTFCGLNGEGMTYRSKPPDKLIDELKHLGLQTGKRLVLYNGQIKCKYHKYSLYKGSMKARSEP